MAGNIDSPGLSWSGAWGFLKSELAPYPGRGLLVARMTIAAVILMLCIMTFRLPGAALGAYYSLIISRDSPHATLDGVITLLTAISISLGTVLVGAVLFAGSSLMHFLWRVVSLFAIFFLISAATKYNFATSFGFLITSTIPIWDFPANTDAAVGNTLYAALSVALGAAVTVIVEIVFANIHPADQIQDGVDDRLRVVALFLRDVKRPGAEIKAKLTQYADIGTGNLRRLLIRTEGGDESYGRRAALLVLAGRLVDLSAGFLASSSSLSEAEQARLTQIAGRIDQIRVFRALSHRQRDEHLPLQPAGAGFIQLLESTVQLMNDALEQPNLIQDLIAKEELPGARFLKRNAFTDSAHLKFALRGTAAALTCYVAYHLLDWRGLYNSVATCMVTALSTTGSSRQKQVLRISGAVVGGIFFALGTEVFLLPHIDSIAAFTLLFAAVTAIAGWFATASPRLSYFGLQLAFAFYLVQLRTFSPDTQLTPVRDNVAGILLGLMVMWLIFDQLSPHDSLREMKQNLVRGIRNIVAYMRERQVTTREEYLKRVRLYRDAVNDAFNNVRANADSVLFEFGRNRAQALAFRNYVRAWQPQIRALFLLQVTLAHMRLREPKGCLPPEVEHWQEDCAELLETLADTLEHELVQAASEYHLEGGVGAQLAESSVAGSLANDSLVIARSLLSEVRSALNTPPDFTIVRVRAAHGGSVPDSGDSG